MDSEEIMEIDITNSVHDSDDTSSDSNEGENKALLDKATELEDKLSTDQTDYQAYLDLISVYKTLGQLDQLRNVRHRFKAEYPLTPEVWLSWIKDELKIATSDEDKRNIEELFEQAVQDYLSVDVWLEYIEFSISIMAEDETPDIIRLILERAIVACGSHVAKGILIWDMYEEFEKGILEALKSSVRSVGSEDILHQQKRIVELFRRQLTIPLLNIEKMYSEFQTWLYKEKLLDPDNLDKTNIVDIQSIQNCYLRTLDELKSRTVYENNLIKYAAGKNLQQYLEYLDFEIKSENGVNDCIRIKCLFERAISENPLESTIWIQYINFMERKVKIPEDILNVSHRSARNCLWSVKCWYTYILLLERYKKPKEDILRTIEKALCNSFPKPEDYRTIWFYYISYLRRQLDNILQDDDEKREHCIEEIRNVVNKACDHLSLYFGENGDPEYRLLLWWARFEAEVGKDMENYRKIWDNIMSLEHNKLSTFYWLKYINMECRSGNMKKVRKLYAKALALETDNPELIGYEWLEFESFNGNFESFEHCQKLFNSRMESIVKKKETQSKTVNKGKKEKTKEMYKKSFVKQTADNNIEEEKPGKKHNNKSNVVSPPKKSKISENTAELQNTRFQHDSEKDDKTVFLSNLAFLSTEEDVKNALNSAGTIEEVSLVKDYKGCSKGYGFVVFSTRAEAEKALKMDRTPLDKRPMFISPCNVEKGTRKSGIRFNTGLEKNKLFVKGLPLTFEQKDVREIFQPYGSLKDVRIVTFRNGYSKGLAYVEYNDEDAAALALIKTDGLEIQDRKLEVALSNPPEKKDRFSLKPIDKNQFAPPPPVIIQPTTTEPRRHARTQLSLVPRAIQVGSKTTKLDTSSEKMDCTDNQSKSDNINKSTKKPLSNEDFRKMLFGNK